MNKMTLILLGLFSLVSCQKHHDSEAVQNAEDLNGVWTGSLNAKGTPTQVHFLLTQNGTDISGPRGDEPFFSVEGYVRTPVRGSVTGKNFSLNDKSICSNPWTFSGEVNNGLMLVNIKTAGSSDVGCYPDAIDQTIAMAR